MAGAFTSSADDEATNEIPHKSYTDTIVSVDAKEHMLVLDGFFANKTFNWR